MKTKEKKAKPAKETNKKSIEKIENEDTLDSTTTKKVENKKENINEQAKDLRKRFKIPNIATIEFIIFFLHHDLSFLEISEDKTVDNNYAQEFDKINKEIKKQIFSYVDKKVFALATIEGIDDFDFIDFSKEEKKDSKAETMENTKYKTKYKYDFLYKNNFSYEDLLMDLHSSFSLHLKIETYGKRSFKWNQYEISKNFKLLVKEKGFYLTTMEDKKVVKDRLNSYIDSFIKDNVIKHDNTYSYENHLKKTYEKFGADYEKYGKNLVISCENGDKNFRTIEFLLALEKQNYVTIDSIFYRKKEKEELLELCMSITFLKSPKEISDLNKYWLIYGDLKVNKVTGDAYYKKEHYFFRDTNGYSFKLLCYLLEHPGEKIEINNNLKQIIKSDNKYTKLSGEAYKQTLMSYIRDYVDEITSKLNIKKDPSPTIYIKIVKRTVILTTME